MEKLLQDLTCPITLELFEDPINVPCCGKAFSRVALLQCLANVCPMCNANISNFDILGAAKNANLAGMVETLRLEEKKAMYRHRWECTLIPLQNNIAELKLSLTNSIFTVKPSLFIIVVDRSGSMSGKPWGQVQAALKHIMALTNQNANTQTKIICYESSAQILETENKSIEQLNDMIDRLHAGGGTNFQAAFAKIGELLDDKDLCASSSVTIAFLTDGQGSGSVNDLKQILCDKAAVVHVVGFGSGCDKKFLEAIRVCGSLEGCFRYAEPEDDCDTLCHKLTSLFSLSTLACSVSPIHIQFLGAKCTNVDIQFPVNTKGTGQYSFWIKVLAKEVSLIINSEVDKEVQVNVKHTEGKWDVKRFDNWLATVVDLLASNLLVFANNGNLNANSKSQTLRLLLLIKQIDQCSYATNNFALKERLQFLQQQASAIKNGLQVNLGKLADVRFGSRFEAIAKKPILSLIENKQEKEEEEYSQESRMFYDRCNTNKSRNLLQEAIANQNSLEHFEIKKDDILFVDIDGNNALHLASYFGQTENVALLIKCLQTSDIDIENKSNETGLTLAIKSRGFYKTSQVLRDGGARIPPHRLKGLKNFAILHKYEMTARFLSRAETFGSAANVIDESMTPELIRYAYEYALEDGANFDVVNYLKVACAKKMVNLIELLLTKHSAEPTLELLLDYCIPKKPDDPETAIYIQMALLFLDKNPTLATKWDLNDLETPLFKSAERGSLPHVQLFLEKGCKIDQPNKLQNTPLWIACAKKYPCIIDELLKKGANPNIANTKGNPPLYNICQRGNFKIAQALITHNADPSFINCNGDTAVLLCCRNGQHEVLELLLDLVDPLFVNHMAHIDGFNALFASVEQDRPLCIEVLVKVGVNIEQLTAEDNQILPGATPLHLASFYGRVLATTKLIECKANVNSLDKNKATPLHTAVQKGNIPIIKLLLEAKSNVHAKDIFNNTPVSYSKSKPEIYNLLVDPLLHMLIQLSKKEFESKEQDECLNVLKEFAEMDGPNTAEAILDGKDHDGSTPLMNAIIYSNFNVVKFLIDMKCDLKHVNTHGINSLIFAHWINNPRITGQLIENPPLLPKEILRLQTASAESYLNRSILYLNISPKNESILNMNESGLKIRMGNCMNAMRGAAAVEMKSIESSDCSVLSLDHFTNPKFVDFSQNRTVWNAKVQIVNLVASGNASLLSISELLSIIMFTNNDCIATILNQWLIDMQYMPCITADFITVLNSGLKKLPNFESEVYVGSTTINRANFVLNSIIISPMLISGSSLFAVALENVPDFSSHKNKKGTVFIIKSKFGKFVAPISQFSYDAEVIFLQGSKFLVSDFYYGDPIALGQANIRKHTFGIKECDLQETISSQKSMIIELEQIA